MVSNIYNIYNDKPVDFPNSFTSTIYKDGGIRVGIIGVLAVPVLKNKKSFRSVREFYLRINGKENDHFR